MGGKARKKALPIVRIRVTAHESQVDEVTAAIQGAMELQDFREGRVRAFDSDRTPELVLHYTEWMRRG